MAPLLMFGVSIGNVLILNANDYTIVYNIHIDCTSIDVLLLDTDTQNTSVILLQVIHPYT